jgi:hypothetical protein
MNLDDFDALGATVTDEWKLADYRPERFAEIAAAALRRHWKDITSVTLEHVFAHVLLAESVCPQLDSNFGEPPIIVFRSERFYVEVLPWLNIVLDVHQHGFDGAFVLLKGSSLHGTFSFETRERYGDHLIVGKLVPTKVELLREGDIRQIRAGSALIHSTFHLDYPSVSLVVRTWRSESGGPQLSYSRAAGVGWDPAHKPHLLEKRIRILRTLSKLGHPQFGDWLERTLEHVDAFAAFRLAVEFEAHLERAGTTQPTCRHASVIALARKDAEERRRVDCLTAFRQTLGSRDHRFFLALLLNVWGRERVLGLVATEYPGRDPVKLVSHWIRELAVERDCEVEVDGSPFSVRFNEAGLEIVRRMLEGRTGDGDEEALATKYGVRADPCSIHAFEETIRESRVFRSLFFEPEPGSRLAAPLEQF